MPLAPFPVLLLCAVGEEGLSFANHHVNGEAQNAFDWTTGNVSLFQHRLESIDDNNPTSGTAVRMTAR